MGMSQSIYIGPYLVFDMPKKQVEHTYRTCPVEGCIGHRNPDVLSAPIPKKDKFCSVCGSKIVEKIEERIVDDFDVWEFIEKFDESLTTTGEFGIPFKVVLIPNRGSHGLRINNTNQGISALPHKENSLGQFYKDYEEEMEYLDKHVGEVEIHYGLISYWS